MPVVLYILLVPILYGLAFFLPLLSEAFQSQGETGALFLLSFYWAMISVFWKRLRPRDLLLTIPALTLAYPIARWLPIYDLITPWREPLLARLEFEARLPGDFARAFLFHSFAALVTASGISFRARRASLSFRRAATDEEEMETLFALHHAAVPSAPELTYYKFKVLLGKSFSLVAEQHGRILGIIHGLPLQDTLFIWGLGTVPAAPDTELRLVRAFFERGEMRPMAGTRWLFWSDTQSPEIPAALQATGFKLIGEEDLRLKTARSLLRGGLGIDLPGAIPLIAPADPWLREIESSG